ncbi:iron ABC transporter permease [Paracidovorax wautersii]|uniref:Iron complex transport system permease protein n=1 Tax=Paracidovorax wautersii TaxID=1177982 RepID=A0ABU1IER4_9BURK|nr:iron ABC transporter permease [Paracidovorax wautersii]MDR6215297.1 iron complex transport system permease protein [Paracidovorax wautersii]
MRARTVAAALGGVALLGLLAVASLSVGSSSVGWRDALAGLAGPWAGALGLPAPGEMAQAIVRELRLPRLLLALLVGAALAVVGGLLQTSTRNDLADPFLFGLSSGAAAAAVAVLGWAGEALGPWTLPAATFAGALLAAGAVLLLVHRVGTQGPAHMVLGGLAISFLLGAVTHVLVFAGDQRAAHAVVFWSLGGLGLARWDNLWLPLAGLLVAAAFVARRHRALDTLLAGDDTAHSLGVAPQRLRRHVFVVAAIATACCVALSGVIGFVGLMVPHLARRLAGPLHARFVPLAALLGAALLAGSDVVARTLLGAQELPVGIVTAGLGAVFVMLLLRRH